jgi:hypothetical protein
MMFASRSTLLYRFFTWRIGYTASNSAYINSHFKFKDKNGSSQPVSDEKMFANALRDINPNFELIRGIANAAKHLEIRDPAKAKTHHTHAPSHAANTATRTTSYGAGPYGAGPYGGTARVMLEGPGGHHLEFLDIAGDVKKLWLQQAAKHSWTL